MGLEPTKTPFEPRTEPGPFLFLLPSLIEGPTCQPWDEADQWDPLTP
jgi:hypothetical protein